MSLSWKDSTLGQSWKLKKGQRDLQSLLGLADGVNREKTADYADRDVLCLPGTLDTGLNLNLILGANQY